MSKRRCAEGYRGLCMSSRGKSDKPFALVDQGALLLQRLRAENKISDDSLLRIDYRPEAENAPFVFDAATGVLHKKGCAGLKKDSRSAQYAVWTITKQDLSLACRKCKPMPKPELKPQHNELTDIVFGVMSMLDQFSAVLGQRGKEFRVTDRGKAMERTFGSLLNNLDKNGNQGYAAAIKTLQTAIDSVNTYNEKLQPTKRKPAASRKKRKNNEGR
jgi:hypothetical protein